MPGFFVPRVVLSASNGHSSVARALVIGLLGYGRPSQYPIAAQCITPLRPGLVDALALSPGARMVSHDDRLETNQNAIY
jgi:nucleoside permease NupC